MVGCEIVRFVKRLLCNSDDLRVCSFGACRISQLIQCIGRRLFQRVADFLVQRVRVQPVRIDAQQPHLV